MSICEWCVSTTEIIDSMEYEIEALNEQLNDAKELIDRYRWLVDSYDDVIDDFLNDGVKKA